MTQSAAFHLNPLRGFHLTQRPRVSVCKLSGLRHFEERVHSGSVVECLAWDQRVTISRLTSERHSVV